MSNTREQPTQSLIHNANEKILKKREQIITKTIVWQMNEGARSGLTLLGLLIIVLHLVFRLYRLMFILSSI